MRPLEQLIDTAECAWPLVEEWAKEVSGRCVIHPPSQKAGEMLERLQVTTRSPMGAVVYYSGGISVAGGWLRILGSGSVEISRDLAGWNAGRVEGCLCIADDVFGGFFAIDGGALGAGSGQVCCFSPRALQWEPLGCGYTGFL